MIDGYGKTASLANPPDGLWVATVTRVEGNDVYVTIPARTMDFEYGPILYDGSLPSVGDNSLVGFLEGDGDTVVGIFPGSAIVSSVEVTYLIASADASPAVKAIADYVCDGVADEEEVNAALQDNPNRGFSVRIYFTGGTYNFAEPISSTQTRSVEFVGAGTDETVLVFDEVEASSYGVIGGYYLRYLGIFDLSIFWYYNYDASDISEYKPSPNALIYATTLYAGRVYVEAYDWGAWEPAIADQHNTMPIISLGAYGIISDCHFEGSGGGIWASSSLYDSSFKRNTFVTENIPFNMQYRYLYRTTIEGNTFEVVGDVAAYAMYLYYSYDVSVRGNQFQGFEHTGIYARGVRLRIVENYIAGGYSTNWEWVNGETPDASIYASIYSGAVEGNYLAWTSGLGIFVDGGDYLTIDNNTIVGISYEAISGRSPSFISISSNLLQVNANLEPAIHISDLYNASISDNLFEQASEDVPIIVVDSGTGYYSGNEGLALSGNEVKFRWSL